MEKCKECKVYSPMCEESGICAFITVGYVMAEDDSCRSGAIVNDVYKLGVNKGRADAIDEFSNKIKEYSGEHYLDCDGYGCQKELVFRTEDFLDEILEQLKEQKK